MDFVYHTSPRIHLAYERAASVRLIGMEPHTNSSSTRILIEEKNFSGGKTGGFKDEG
jgi:hypothetical protein